jgi:copper resistance protein D
VNLLSLNGWDVLGLGSKLLLYLGIVSIAGGSFAFWLIADRSRKFFRHNLLYVGLGAFTAFNAVILYFLAQAGTLNDSGPIGMFDWDTIAFLLQTAVGDGSMLRCTALLIILIAQLLALTHISRRIKPPTQRFVSLLLAGNALALMAVAYSFRVTGHVATLSVIAQSAVIVHVLAMGLWAGSLYPLLRVLHQYELTEVSFILHRFSTAGMVIVALLLLSALAMLLELLASPTELLDSSYGLTVLVKMLLVYGLLLLATLNRFRFLPRLSESGGLASLHRSIAGELAIVLLVLLVSAYLSTVVGPVSH